MANIWLIEGSQVVRHMVEIALDGLPAKLSFASHINELLQGDIPSPHLLICAEFVTGSQNTEESASYQAQVKHLAEQNYKCPVIILQNQHSAKIEPYSIADGLPLVDSIRKPFKTFELLKSVCNAMAWQVPHENIFAAQSRVIPLAKPKVAVNTPSVTSLESPEEPPAPPVMAEPPAPPVMAEPPAPPVMAEPPTPPVMAEPPAPPVMAEPPAPPVMAEPSAPPVLSVVTDHPALHKQAQDLGPIDLSPQAHLEEDKEHGSIGSAEDIDPQSEQQTEPPSADESFQFDFPQLATDQEQASFEKEEEAEEEAEEEDKEEDESHSIPSTPLPEELQDDWLTENGATPTAQMTTQVAETDDEASQLVASQELNSSQRIAEETNDSSKPIESLSSESFENNKASESLENRWLQELKGSVEIVSDQALAVVQKAIQANTQAPNQASNHPTEPLSTHEMRVLIERIAWEVVPTLASVELRDRIQQMTNK